MISSLHNVLRATRDWVPGLTAAQGLLREPWYRMLEILFTRGISVRLAGGEHVRLQPWLLGMRPEIYEETLTAILADHLTPGLTGMDIGAHVGLHTLMFSCRVDPRRANGYVDDHAERFRAGSSCGCALPLSAVLRRSSSSSGNFTEAL